MGTLRTLFAITVVFSHSYGFVFVGGRNAVRLFYIISGFLISYILVEARTYKTVKAFYVNRYLRLYPIYFAVVMLTLLANAFGIYIYAGFVEVYRSIPWSAELLLVFSNAFLFCQDWVMFSRVADNALEFTANFSDSKPLLYQGLIVPQAWTLGIELAFYLVAPWLLPRRKMIYLLLAASLGLRIWLIAIGLGTRDPWSYRFFPTELALFLFGSLAHQVLLPWYRGIEAGRLRSMATRATGFLLVFSLAYFLIPVPETIKAPLLFVSFVLLLPLTFLFQNDNGFDKWIGDLSYPIYVGHLLVVTLTLAVGRKFGLTNLLGLSLLCVVLSVALAIALNRFVAEPFERIRAGIRRAALPTAPAN